MIPECGDCVFIQTRERTLHLQLGTTNTHTQSFTETVIVVSCLCTEAKSLILPLHHEPQTMHYRSSTVRPTVFTLLPVVAVVEHGQVVLWYILRDVESVCLDDLQIIC